MKTTTNKIALVSRQLFGLALVFVVGLSMIPTAAFADGKKPVYDGTPVTTSPTYNDNYYDYYDYTSYPDYNYSYPTDNSINNSGNDNSVNLGFNFNWNNTKNTNNVNNYGDNYGGNYGNLVSTNNTSNSNANSNARDGFSGAAANTPYSYGDYTSPNVSYSNYTNGSYNYGGYTSPHTTYDYNDHAYTYGDYHSSGVTYSNYVNDSYNYNDYHAPSTHTTQAPTCTINVNDSNIQNGDSVTLTWNSTNATSGNISNIGSVGTSGSRTVTPGSDTTYTFSVSGAGGNATCTTNVNVENNHDSAAPSCSLEASDTSITEGDSTTLRWYVTGNTDSASINQGIGSVNESGGTKRVSPDSDTTYRLTVRGEGGTRTCAVTVNVDPDNQNNVSLNVTPVGTIGNQPYTSVYLADAPYTGAGDMTTIIGSVLALAAAALIGGYFIFAKSLPFAFKRATVNNAPVVVAEAKKSQAKAIRVGGIDQNMVYEFMNAYAANDVNTMQSIRASLKADGIDESRLASRVNFAATDALTARKFGGVTENALLSIDTTTLEALAA